MDTTQQLQNVYRTAVLDHSRHPRNFRRLEPADRTVQGHNPLCGDKVTLYLRLQGDEIKDIAFEGTGCAISLASASIMTESVNGKSVPDAQREAERIMQRFQAHEENQPALTNDMAALEGVREYPSRIKCATLAWKTLQAALRADTGAVTTED
jgi:nitrogen fixation NifU-like protein